MPNEATDMEAEELLEVMIDAIQKNPGILLFVKWTCPKCGERVTSNVPNRFFTEGYKHDDCGHVYLGDRFGLMAVYVAEVEEEEAGIEA